LALGGVTGSCPPNILFIPKLSKSFGIFSAPGGKLTWESMSVFHSQGGIQ